MANVGRPTELDDEMMLKIRDLVLEHKTLKEIAEIIDISYATMRYWSAVNYQSFNDKMLSYKHERMLRKAEDNIEVLQDSEDEKVALQANTFVAETIGKRSYSKRAEMTGADGKDLVVQVVKYGDDSATTQI